MDMFTLEAIGVNYNERKTPKDDYWGEVISEIRVDKTLGVSCLDGIESFSHLEIVYLFHLVQEEDIQYASRHPRNNQEYPKVGIFAQRGKNRPNRIGVTIVELLRKEESSLIVKGLDAIDGTPIIDIKPVMKEFLPKRDIKQPQWATELMSNYWK